jgi:hypothetical protein
MSNKQLKAENRNLRAKLEGKRTVQNAPQLSRYMQELADQIVNPSEGVAKVFPSQTPGLAGAVTFPIMQEISGFENYLIRVAPDVDAPLMITHDATVAEGGSYGGDFFFSASPGNMASGNNGCIVMGALYGSGADQHLALPISSAAGATVNLKISNLKFYDNTQQAQVFVQFFESGSWVSRGSTFITENETKEISGVTVSSSATAFRLDPGNTYGHFSFSMLTTVGTFGCGPRAENIMTAYEPDWHDILGVSERISIPAMDCLVTYQGSTLKNNGSIIAVNLREDVSSEGDYYATLSKKRYDKYEGRLASEGETEGGAHWHLQHNNLASYALHDPRLKIDTQRGYIAIKGADPTQPIKVHVNVCLNYRTDSPSFPMVHQPYWGEFSLLLHLLRDKVPLTSSNDNHLSKLINLGKKAASATARYALQNPEQLFHLLSLLAV